MISLYERLKNAGCEISNYYSDLYVKDTPKARAIISDYKHDAGIHKPDDVPDAWISRFKSNIDGRYWLDIPMMFDPYWQAKGLA